MAQKRRYNGIVKPYDTVDRTNDWHKYRNQIGDRSGMFKLLADEYEIRQALYVGSYLDLSPSIAIEQVTYVDNDRRAIRFFADLDAVVTIVGANANYTSVPRIEFIGTDYRESLPIEDNCTDLLISLYAGFIWEPCQRYLKPNGYFLANNSHGDVGIALLDNRLELISVIHHKDGQYQLTTKDLNDYITPKNGHTPTIHELHRTGRGISYRNSAFAYVFRLTKP